MTEPEPPRSHWAALEERGVFLGLWFMMTVYRLLGRRGCKVFLYPVMAYFMLATGEARRSSRQFLTRVYASSNGSAMLKHPPGYRDIYRHFMAFGEALVDKLAAWAGEIRVEDVDFENRDMFEALLREKRGALLIVSHLGNTEVSRALGKSVMASKMNVLVHTKHSANFGRIMQKINPDSHIDLIQVTELNPAIAADLCDRVAEGEFVVIAGDRTSVANAFGAKGARDTWVPFLGQPAPFPQGPMVLASLLKCPVLTMFCIKNGDRYTVSFEHFADAVELPRGERQQHLDAYIAAYAKRLEAKCNSTPYQWFNFFDFWRSGPTMATHPSDNESSQSS